MTNEWIQLTSRTDRVTVWVNMGSATVIVPDSGGSKISLQGREKDLFVSENPELVMSRRADAARGRREAKGSQLGVTVT